MRILLDTHAWLWMVAAPGRLGLEARVLVESTGTRLYLSAASSWEISIKQALGRLDMGGDPQHVIPELMLRSTVAALDVTHQHALRAGTLPAHLATRSTAC